MPEKNLGVWGKAPSINTASQTPLKQMDPSLRDKLTTLTHDLNSHWGIIHWTTHELNRIHLPIVEYQLYEEMFYRNIADVQSIFAQLLSYVPKTTLLATMPGLIIQLRTQKSIIVLNQLSSLILDLNQSIGRLLT